LNLDAATIAWFRSTYVDWQQQAASVLRAWVAAHSIMRRTPLSERVDSEAAANKL
jgi:hypothetical protein